jgi:hypothetical protein
MFHLSEVGKTRLRARIYAHNDPRAHPSVLEEVEGYKNILFFLKIPDLSFQEVEGYKHNFVSLRVLDATLDLNLASGLCQTVGYELFFYLSYLFRSWQNTRFAK